MFTDINAAIDHARVMRKSHGGRHYGLRQRKGGTISVDRVSKIKNSMWTTKNDDPLGGKKRHEWTILEPSDIPLILEMVMIEGISRAEVARKFDVSPSLIEHVVKNRKWKR